MTQGDFPMGKVGRGEERRNEPSTILTAFSGNPSDPWCSAPVTSSSSSTQTQFTPPGGDRQQQTSYYPRDVPRPAAGMAPTRSMELIGQNVVDLGNPRKQRVSSQSCCANTTTTTTPHLQPPTIMPCLGFLTTWVDFVSPKVWI